MDRLEEKFEPKIEIVVPPPKNAVHSANAQRNQHIESIAEHGRMKWRPETRYNQGSQVEAQISRWKQVIGDRLQADDFDNQRAETQIAFKTLNRMTAFGRVAYERVF
ncbi:hypothetical protein [Ruegeria hyattellae]|uniref:hypothetical protein n=1 Tax=Ruegeria hyattellae TaxID=3233337 RepID=UPI00355AFB78